MNHQLILQGISLDQLKQAIAEDVIKQLRPLLPQAISPVLLNRSELAGALGISLSSLDRLVKSEGFPSLMVQGTRKFKIDAVLQFLEKMNESDAA